MCDCSTLNITPNHPVNACPVTAYLFCSICQIQGHATMKCPDRLSQHYRKPEFVEQLIPSHVLNHYNITSLTPITSDVQTPLPYIHGDPVIEIPVDEDGKNVRATLAAYNLPSSSVKENKRVMEAFGDLIGKKLVPTETKKRVIKLKKSSKSSAVA